MLPTFVILFQNIESIVLFIAKIGFAQIFWYAFWSLEMLELDEFDLLDPIIDLLGGELTSSKSLKVLLDGNIADVTKSFSISFTFLLVNEKLSFLDLIVNLAFCYPGNFLNL